MLSAESVGRMRNAAESLRAGARAEAAAFRFAEAISLCRQALAGLSEWERAQHETEIQELERLAPAFLTARVDLHRASSDYVPHAPVLACEVLSDLTKYLYQMGNAEEAKREIDTFTERYPRGSFRSYEFFDHRYDRTITVSVTKREQATLRRVEKALIHCRRQDARR